MPSTRFLLKALAIAVILAAAAFAVSAPASNQPSLTASDPVIRTVLQPDLTLHSTFSLASDATRIPIYHVCRCSCGFSCTTDADCGLGGVCEWEQFITCCDKTGQIKSEHNIASSFHQGGTAALDVKCK